MPSPATDHGRAKQPSRVENYAGSRAKAGAKQRRQILKAKHSSPRLKVTAPHRLPHMEGNPV